MTNGTTASQPILMAYVATDLDGHADVGLTIEAAKRRAGPGCDTIIALHDISAPADALVGQPKVASIGDDLPASAWVTPLRYGSQVTFYKPPKPEGWDDDEEKWYCYELTRAPADPAGVALDIDKMIASGPIGVPSACAQRNGHTASWDWITCDACGAIHTGSGEREWGIARNTWFKSVAEARFYKQNGKLPEAPK